MTFKICRIGSWSIKLGLPHTGFNTANIKGVAKVASVFPCSEENPPPSAPQTRSRWLTYCSATGMSYLLLLGYEAVPEGRAQYRVHK